MPRVARLTPGGVVFHVLNRGNDRKVLFEQDGDYAAFLAVMAATQRTAPMRVLSYVVMPTHWHLVLWPVRDGDLGRFMQRLTVTHVRRWREFRQVVGQGHLYQGSYKSFPVAEDRHFLTLCRYVERNALRAGLVDIRIEPGRTQGAAAWPWSSLSQRERGLEAGTEELPTLTAWPIDRPRDWVKRVNQPETQAELEAMRICVARGRPLGSDDWIKTTVSRLGLGFTMRARGRPKKQASATE